MSNFGSGRFTFGHESLFSIFLIFQSFFHIVPIYSILTKFQPPSMFKPPKHNSVLYFPQFGPNKASTTFCSIFSGCTPVISFVFMFLPEYILKLPPKRDFEIVHKSIRFLFRSWIIFNTNSFFVADIQASWINLIRHFIFQKKIIFHSIYRYHGCAIFNIYISNKR